MLRRVRETLLALLPLALGLIWTIGLMYVFDLKFNLGNVFGLPLILGAAAEYGLNIVMRFMEDREHGGPLVARSHDHGRAGLRPDDHRGLRQPHAGPPPRHLRPRACCSRSAARPASSPRSSSCPCCCACATSGPADVAAPPSALPCWRRPSPRPTRSRAPPPRRPRDQRRHHGVAGPLERDLDQVRVQRGAAAHVGGAVVVSTLTLRPPGWKRCHQMPSITATPGARGVGHAGR